MGFNTFDPHGRRLIDEPILNSVFVLMLSTSILGPILTQRYAPMMVDAYRRPGDRDAHAA